MLPNGSHTKAQERHSHTLFVLQLFFDIDHHRAGVVLNPHPPLVYVPKIVAGLTDEYHMPHLDDTYGAGYWAFNEYAQVF